MKKILLQFRYLSLRQVLKAALFDIGPVLVISALWIFSHPYFSFFTTIKAPCFQLIALVWLLKISEKATPVKAGFYWGFSSFLVYFCFLRWMGQSIYLAPWGIVGQLLASLLLSSALFLWAYVDQKIFKTRSMCQNLAASLLWGLIEWSRQYWFCGFPWNGLSFSWIDFPFVSDVLALLGPFFTSSFILFVAFILAKASSLSSCMRKALLSSCLFMTVVCVSKIFERTYTLQVQVAALHTNMPLHYFPGSYDRLDVWGKFLQSPPKWLEGAWKYPRFCLTHEVFFPGGTTLDASELSNETLASKLASLWKCHLISGIEDDGLETGVANAIGIWNKEGQLEGYYHKQILVPFAECFPLLDFPWIGPLFLEISKEYGILEPMMAGKLGGRYDLEGVPTLVSICFEETFPSLIAKESKRGALLWMSSSNDGWFPQTTLAQDHLLQARLVSASVGLPLARSTQQGYTAIIDGWGQIKGNVLSPQDSWGWRIEKELEGRLTFYGQIDEFYMIITASFFVILTGICSLRRKARQS